MARGIHGRSGPAPDPNALRRSRDGGDWVTLPAGGRVGEVPVWPLSDAVERELVLWARYWGMPQAVMWERNRQHDEVALFVRAVVVAEDLEATTAARTLVRQLQEALGLSVPGLARNRWVIEEPEADGGAGLSGRLSARDRFKVVPGGAA